MGLKITSNSENSREIYREIDKTTYLSYHCSM